ncbi:MAG: ASPIC/UnbV domain-containing protein, partial [Planctomycetota bacterium]
LGFGTQPIDYDNDGWSDLFVGNGHIEDLSHLGKPFRMPPQLLVNQQAQFVEMVVRSEDAFWTSERLSRGAAILDWNRDGRIDLAVSDLTSRFALLENQTESTNAWIQLELVGRTSSRDAIGAGITVIRDGKTTAYALMSGDGYLAKNEHVVFIGIGDDESDEATINVRWPSGRRQTLPRLTSGRYLLIEGESEPWKRW